MSTYLSVPHNLSPFISTYKRNGDVLTKLADPATLPTGIAYGAAWSPDITYLSLTVQYSPYMMTYKRSGDVLTKLADPATLPTSSAQAAPAWSPDGVYLSIAEPASPYILTYKRAGDVFTKLADPATLPTNAARGAAWSPDGVYLSVAHAISPYITTYKRAGDVLTKLADPATLPTSHANDVAWSADGVYLSVAHGVSPYVTTYKRAGDVLTKIADPATLPTGECSAASWSPDGVYLSMAVYASPFVVTYKRAGDVLTKLADPATVPSSYGRGVSWSSDSTYLSIGHSGSPFLTTYKRAGDVLTKLADPATIPPDSVYKLAWSAALNSAPTAPTWDAPADNSYNDIASSLLLDWTFADPDAGDTQSAYALSKSVDGGALSYWNAGTSAWVGSEVENPTATSSVTLASSWASDGESVDYKVKTWDAASAEGVYGLALTVNGESGDVPTISAPATSAVLTGSSADVSWTVAAQAAYKIRVLTSADAELYDTGKIVSAVTEVTLGYVFIDGQTGLKVELTTYNSFDIPGVDTNTGISVSFTPPATPVLTVTANSAGYISVAIADPTPAGSQPTVVTHDVFVRVAAGGRQSGERPVGGDGIRISTGTVVEDGTFLDYGAATGTDFEYRTLAVAGTATAYSAWT